MESSAPSSLLKSCKMLEFCISRAMVYANTCNYKQAVVSFISDVKKTDCTKCLLEKPDNRFITMNILNDDMSKTSPDKFKEVLRGFSICCVCSSNIGVFRKPPQPSVSPVAPHPG